MRALGVFVFLLVGAAVCSDLDVKFHPRLHQLFALQEEVSFLVQLERLPLSVAVAATPQQVRSSFGWMLSYLTVG